MNRYPSPAYEYDLPPPDELAARRLWKGLLSGDSVATSRALLAGADPNALYRGQRPLDGLEAFTDDEAAAAALALVICGATVTEQDVLVHHLVTEALPQCAYGCGVNAEDATLGMHSLPPVLYPAFLAAAKQCGEAVYFRDPGTRAVTSADAALWKALEQGDLDGLFDALSAGASPGRRSRGRLPIESLGTFEGLDAAEATLALLMAGSPPDLDNPFFYERLQLALISMGFQCGAGSEDVEVGMHMLPPELYGFYIQTAEHLLTMGQELRDGTLTIEEGRLVRKETPLASSGASS